MSHGKLYNYILVCGGTHKVCYELLPPLLNPLKPEFTTVIFIHYKPRIAAAILDL